MEDLCRTRVSEGTENDSDTEGLSRRNVWDGTEEASYSGGFGRKNTEDMREKQVFYPSFEHLLLVLRENSLNWFSFVEELRLTVSRITGRIADGFCLLPEFK